MAVLPVGKLAPIARAMLAPSAEGHQLLLEADIPSRAFSKGNVYYVILDGYAGASSLRRYVGYNIEPFLQQMRDLGYSDIDSARTNYTSTYVSMMAMLEMDYVVSESSPRYGDRLSFFPPALWRGRQPRSVRRLAAAGYDFIHLSNSWARCLPRLWITCFRPRHRYAYINEVAAAFLAPTRVRQAIARLWRPSGYDALSSLSAGLQDLTWVPGKAPTGLRPGTHLPNDVRAVPGFRAGTGSHRPPVRATLGRELGGRQALEPLRGRHGMVRTQAHNLLANLPKLSKT